MTDYASMTYAKWTVAKLQAACAEAGLDATGNKTALYERFQSSQGATTPAAADEPAPTARTSGRSKRAKAEPEPEEEEEEEEPAPKKGKKAAAPKKTAPAKKAPAAKKGKKAAAEPEEEEEEEEEEAAPAKGKKGAKVAPASKAVPSKAKKIVHKVDPACPLSSASVYEDFDATLNQTNIGANNNKFYRIQVLQSGSSYYCWTHWGRVGESGQNANQSCGSSSAAAISAFEKKYKDKTGSKWEDRANFVKKAGKYDLLEMDHTEDPDEDAALEERLAAYNSNSPAPARSASPAPTKFKPSEHPKEIEEFLALLFDPSMFQQAMKSFEIDTAKMPLGKLSKNQITKGGDVLEEIEVALKAGASTSKLNELSSKFYGIIPHDFGRRVPPGITSLEALKQKQDLINVLNDIEIAQTLAEDSKKKAKAAREAEAAIDVNALPRNPLDDKYDTLNCDLGVLAKSSKEYKIIEKYIAETMNSWGGRGPKLSHVFTVDRHNEDKRFAAHKSIKNRKLCWHGTNVAVVAAILNSGLRIMPHSGGRVGKGIYFASEHSKSAGYVGPASFKGKSTAVMFLAEVALGEEHSITRDDSSLKVAPKGFDSIVARGCVEPDPAKDVIIKIDGNDVVVPQGKPISMSQYKGSSFSQSEYLVYEESKHRIRYALQFEWGW